MPCLGVVGCEVEETEQRLTCYKPGDDAVCVSPEALPEVLYPYSDRGCEDRLTSVDQGPVETLEGTLRSCCYLATFRPRPWPDICLGSGRPLLTASGPRLSSLRRGGAGWG
ncbi:MAG: hypothetical protein EOO75_14865 [Myxococcales bacterium]|nr:MAG: hypothetical protein EOO75_14865 [Myxococcales bacterium]